MAQKQKTNVPPPDVMEEDESSSEEEMDAESEETGEGEDTDALERRVIELKNLLAANPYAYENHKELINCLEKLGELDELRLARKRMHELYPLSDELWLSWLHDEVKCCEDKNEVVALFDDAVKDYLSIQIWLEYCQFAIGTFLAESPDKVRSVLDRALATCGSHVISGSQVWEVYREFEMVMLQIAQAKSGSEAEKSVACQKNRIESLFKAQLALPLFEMESTYNEYCEWLEGGEPDKGTKAAYDNALKMYTERKPLEDNLLESDPPPVEAYTSYLSFEEEHGDLSRVTCLYERAVKDHPLIEELWRHYCAFLERKLVFGEGICAVYERAVRNIPWSAELWIKWAQSLERCHNDNNEKITKIFEDANQAGFQKESDQVQVWIAYLDYLRRKINWEQDHEAELTALRSCFARAEEAVNKMQERRDHLPTVLKYWAFVEVKYCQNVEKARQLWHMVSRVGRGNQADLWLEYFSFERAFGDSPLTCISVLQSALNAVVDRPEAICAAYVNFAREACTLEQLDEAIAACEKRNALLKKRAKEQNDRETAKAERNAGGAKGGRHAGLGFQKGKSDNQAEFVKPGQQKQQQKPQQHRPVVKEKEESPSNKRKFEATSATIEGESAFKKPFAPAVMKKPDVESSFKEPTIPPPHQPPQPQRRDINAFLADDNPTTIFLSNLDYTVTEEEIREFFKNCGPIEEIRLVMKAQKLNRGFAYVKFADLDGAKKALEMDRQKIRNRPAFVSPYVDKKESAGAAAAAAVAGAEKKSGLIYSANLEKNKLFIRNIPLSCTEESLKKAFSAHGVVKAARLVTFKDGNPKGLAYIEFATADEAEKARQATNGTAFLGEEKILTVEISNPPPKRAVGDFAPSSTSVRKGTVAAFYSNLGVGTRHNPTGQGQQTRISVPTPQEKAESGASSNGGSEKPKMSNEDFRRFLTK